MICACGTAAPQRTHSHCAPSVSRSGGRAGLRTFRSSGEVGGEVFPSGIGSLRECSLAQVDYLRVQPPDEGPCGGAEFAACTVADVDEILSHRIPGDGLRAEDIRDLLAAERAVAYPEVDRDYLVFPAAEVGEGCHAIPRG